MNYLDDILRDTFKPGSWSELTDLQQLLVASDVLEIAETENMRVPDAAVTLRARIGGAAVLPSYARSLEAGYLRRQHA